MKNTLILIFFSLLFISCKNESIEYYENGSIKRIYSVENNILEGKMEEFYKDGKNLKSIKYFENGKLVDSAIYFDKKGKISEIQYYNLNSDTIFIKNFKNGIKEFEGKFYNGKKVNIWNYYHQKGYLKSKFEYIDSCGSQYTNQGWVFNEKGDTIFDKSNFFKIKKLKKTYKRNELINFNIEYKNLFKKSTPYLIISNNINKNYCNINDAKSDILIPNENLFYINVKFSKVGKQNLRGIIVENTMINEKEADRILFFDIPIEVK